MNIKLVKLISGMNIIADIEESEDKVKIKKGFIIEQVMTPRGISLVPIPATFTKLELEDIEIKKDNILLIDYDPSYEEIYLDIRGKISGLTLTSVMPAESIPEDKPNNIITLK